MVSDPRPEPSIGQWTDFCLVTPTGLPVSSDSHRSHLALPAFLRWRVSFSGIQRFPPPPPFSLLRERFRVFFSSSAFGSLYKRSFFSSFSSDVLAPDVGLERDRTFLFFCRPSTPETYFPTLLLGQLSGEPARFDCLIEQGLSLRGPSRSYPVLLIAHRCCL